MLITKWAKAIISHPRDIIKGNYYRLINKNDLLYLSRDQKCKTCKYLESVPSVGEICGECGCPLESKLRLEEFECNYIKK